MARRQEPSRGILDPVAKMLRLPFGTPEFIDRIFTGSVNTIGRRTLFLLITTWDAAGGVAGWAQLHFIPSGTRG